MAFALKWFCRRRGPPGKIYIERSTWDKRVHRTVSAAYGIREGFQNMQKRIWHGNGLQASGNGREFKITSVVTRHSLPSWSIHISGQPISYLKWKSRNSIQIGMRTHIHTTKHSHHSFSSPGRKETTFEETHFSPLSSCQTCSINSHLVSHQSISRSLFPNKCVGH